MTIIGFSEQEQDEESEYTQMGARTYNPALGRFMSVDPLFEAFPGQSSYSYAFNSPLSWSDPSGLAPEKEKKRDRVLTILLKDISNEIANIDRINYEASFLIGDLMRMAHSGILQYFNLSSFLVSAGYNAAEYDMMNFNRREEMKRRADADNNNRTGEGNGNNAANGQITVSVARYTLANPLSPGKKKIFNITLNMDNLLNNTIDGIKKLIWDEVGMIMKTSKGRELLSHSNKYDINITKSGTELGLIGINCKWPSWVSGVANFKYPDGCNNTSGLTCSTSLSKKTIYIASEFFDNDPHNQGYILTMNLEFDSPLFYVLAHEIAHMILSFDCKGTSDHEKEVDKSAKGIWEEITKYKFEGYFIR